MLDGTRVLRVRLDRHQPVPARRARRRDAAEERRHGDVPAEAAPSPAGSRVFTAGRRRPGAAALAHDPAARGRRARSSGCCTGSRSSTSRPARSKASRRSCAGAIPTGGLVPPGEFIPLAEELGLIEAIGDWVLGELVRQSRSGARTASTCDVGFNLSPRQLWSAHLAEKVMTKLAPASSTRTRCRWRSPSRPR